MLSPEYVGLDRLEGIHHDSLSLALRNVLNSGIALITYAQIIDGLPTADVAWDQYSSRYDPDHPINNHETLCEGAIEKAKAFRDNFAMADVKVDPEKLDRYRETIPSSRSFQLRLIEITACALHQIAVQLSQMQKMHDPATTAGHDVEAKMKWERPPDGSYRVAPWPTIFVATQFTAYDWYPNSIHDIVRYWAENRILGGVALFDHSQPWTNDDEPNVYFQCTRERVTFRVCQLLDTQQSELISFLLAESEESNNTYPLPILPNSKNRVRIDPGDAIPVHKVYRDLWERKVTPERRRAPRLERPKTSLDYPELDIDAEVERLNRIGLAIAFHVECADIAANFGTSLRKYSHITVHSYCHVLVNQKSRRSLVRGLFENALRKAYGKLSPELWRIVSDDDELIRLYAIAEISLHHRKTDWSVSPSLPLCSRNVRVDGVEYVSSLTNSSGVVRRQTSQVTHPAKNDVLYISRDHLGIRQVITDPNKARPDTVYQAYWQTVPTNNQALSFRGDGLKLREVLNPSIYPRVLWPHPVKPSELDSMTFYYAGWGEGELEARLQTLTFNERGTKGYSVCWSNDEMVSVHVHRNKEYLHADSSLLYGEQSEFQDLKWTYYPIQEDEYVKEIWLRGTKKHDATRPLPSQDGGGSRYHLSTPWGLQKYKRPSDMALGNHRHWDLIAKTSINAPMQIYFSPSAHGLPLVAAPKRSDNDNNLLPPLQRPLGVMPRFNPLHTLHYSSASLENATETTVCKSNNEKDTAVIRHFDLENSRMNETRYKKITGVLFRYADGNKQGSRVKTKNLIMSELQIHNFYRIWFTWVDPLTLIPTVFGLIFTPEFMLDGLIPLSMSSYNPDQAFLFHQLAALYAFVGIMLAVLLRTSSNLKVWRVVVAGVLLIDISILLSLSNSLTFVYTQHQLSSSTQSSLNFLGFFSIAIMVSEITGRDRSDSRDRNETHGGTINRRRHETFTHTILPTLLFSLDLLRDGLEFTYGHNKFTVVGDIMQLTVTVALPKPEYLVARLQDEGYLRREPLPALPKAVKDLIKANGWTQMRPYDREEPCYK
ncbi:hypothetical protein FBEOM_6185 [Fusarium beomiforme]|uniref:DUF7704 domain-containing protein n=1 Tax=Fusarium beomiforme TaxID=44412 RepID=A0A9P5AJJ0_9HYPO|nr:hypothetical protein FBEOM_6185 [Fusarium beomiforme]